MRLQTLVDTRRFREALEYYHALGSPAARGDPQHQLLAADAAARVGDMANAHALASCTFDKFSALMDNRGLMRAANLLGAIAFERGQIEHARGYFTTAARLASEYGDRAMAARSSNNRAIIAHLRGEHRTALTLYKTAADIYSILGDTRGAAETCHNLGVVLRQLDRLGEAADSARTAVRMAEKAHTRSLHGLALLGLAEITLEQGDLMAASAQIVRGAALAAEAEDRFNGLEAGRLRALLAFRRGDYAIAHHLAEVAASVAGGLGSALLRTECTAISALALRADHRCIDSERRREEALSGYQELGAGYLRERFESAWGN